jgi:hypothetical protein
MTITVQYVYGCLHTYYEIISVCHSALLYSTCSFTQYFHLKMLAAPAVYEAGLARPGVVAVSLPLGLQQQGPPAAEEAAEGEAGGGGRP